MKKVLFIALLIFLCSCTKKMVETRVVTDYELYKKAYEQCISSYGKLDSASLKYYDRECKKDATSRATKMKKFLVYKKQGKIIKEIELKDE